MKKRLTLLMLVLLLVSCAPKGKEIPLDAYVHCLEQDMDVVVENVEKTGITLNQTDHFFWEAKDAVKYKNITMDLLMSFDEDRTLNMYTFQYKHEDTKKSREAATVIYDELLEKYGEPQAGTLVGYSDWDEIWDVFLEEAKKSGAVQNGAHFTQLSAVWAEENCIFTVFLYEDEKNMDILVQYHVPDLGADNE